MSVFEVRHHELLCRWMSSPILFSHHAGSTVGHSILSSGGLERPLPTIAPNDMRDFYHKDCIIYLNCGITVAKRLELLDAIYFEWFPHRDRVEEFARGSFFAGFFKPEIGIETLEQLSRFHFAALCPKLLELQPEVLEKEPSILHRDYGKPKQKGLFHVRERFQKVFLVVDKVNWEEEGVCVVSEDERIHKMLGKPAEELEVKGVGTFKAQRAKLEIAMRAVVADDEERSKENREWSDFYDKWCGGNDQDPPRR